MKRIEIKTEINNIKKRMDDIYKILDIYNINDEDSIKSIREELKIYKEKLKKITDEEFE